MTKDNGKWLALGLVAFIAVLGLSLRLGGTAGSTPSFLAALSQVLGKVSSCPVISTTISNLTPCPDRSFDTGTLQQYLMDQKLLVIPAPTNCYGLRTRSAIMLWQMRNGLITPTSATPGTVRGVFGANERAKLNQLCGR